MAQTIVTTCDAHEETDEHRGTPVLVSLDGVNVLVVDLCDEARAKLVEPLRALVAEYGRPVPSDELAAMRRRSPSGGKTKPTSKVPCPRCDNGKPLARNSLQSHVETKHGTTLPVLESELGHTVDGGELKVWCDVCGGGFSATTGLAAHKRGKACPGRQQAKKRAPKSAAKRAAKSA